MGEPAPAKTGVIASVRRLGRTTVAMMQNRLELFSVELEEQKLHVVKILILAGAAIFLGNTALLAVSATIVVIAGERARVAVLVGLSLIYIAATVWACLTLRKAVRSAPPPFQDTISEFKKDSDWLNPPD